MSDSMLTAFFGGSFDPPHYGHLGVALGALRSGRCSKVLWVPAFDPPHKRGVERLAFEQRKDMASQMISGFDAMEVSDIEQRLALVPSYTFSVMEALEKETDGKLALLIGEDSLAQLHTWFNAHELVKKYPILTYPRNGYRADRAYLREFWNEEETEKLLSGRLEGKFFEISSTEIRKKLAKNANWSNIKELTEKLQITEL